MHSSCIKLSFIVPMYNVGLYVERCLRSLVNQDIPPEDYEIICVNDGSPDNCLEIVSRLQLEIPNIVLINQPNQGVSTARNNAIAKAKGRFIMAIDPDDYIVRNSLKVPLLQLESQQLDVLYCGFDFLDVNHNSIWTTDYTELVDRVDTGTKGYFAVRGKEVRDPDRSWGVFFRLDLLRKYQIEYPKDVPFLEDAVFLGKVFSVAEKVGYSNLGLYIRTTRIGSATNSNLFISERSYFGFLNALKDLDDFNKSNITINKSLIDHVCGKMAFLALTPDCQNFKLISYAKKLRGVNMYLKTIDSENLKYNYKRMLKFYRVSPFIYFLLFRFIK